MITRPLLAAAALLSAVASGAAAQGSPEDAAAKPLEQAASDPATASPSAPTGADAERKICRTDKVTGSLSRRSRICLTAAQWREVHDRTRRGVDEMNSAASGGKECVLDGMGGCRVSIN